MKNRKYFLLLLLLLVFVTSGSLAFFNAKQDVRNIITTGSVALEIIEKDENGMPYPYEGVSSVTPGSRVVKDVSFKNVGKNDFWLRAKVGIQFEDKQLDPSYVELNFNRRDWSYQEGYFYYRHILKVGEVSESLFDTVYFSKTMPNHFKSQNFIIDIQAEAVQSDFNGESVFDVLSWE